MHRLVYNIGIHLFIAVVYLLQPLNSKLRKMVAGRRAQRITAKNQGDVIVIHCASLGEFEQGRPLIEKLRVRYPSARLVLTFFSASGYEIRKNYTGVDEVYYLPFDTAGGMRKFFYELKPSMCFIIKYEYWYNMLATLNRLGTKAYIVSAIFRQDSIFFKNKLGFGKFYRDILNRFTKIFVQDSASEELLSSIGIGEGRVIVAGDTRFDRVAKLTTEAKDIELVARFTEQVDPSQKERESVTVVCGSTWAQDEELLIEVMKERPRWKFIIVPHEISNSEIKRLMESSGRKAVRYSQGELSGDESLLIVDTIGLLSSIYRYGSVSYIGGGFGAGIHNTLEAAAWGLPVIFGTKYHKFREAVGLIKCGAARSISNGDELLDSLDYYLSEEGNNFGAVAREYVERHLGASEMILKTIE